MSLKVLDIAASYVGYLEKASNNNLDNFTANAGYNNYTKFNRDYMSFFNESSLQGAAWCAMFVSSCFAYAYGSTIADKMIYGHYAYCPYGVNNFKSNSAWYTSNPQAGDIIFFRSAVGSTLSSHTGLVYNVDSNYVYTIEGNTSSTSGVVANGGAVAKKTYKLSYNRILGYGRPNYNLVKGTSTIDSNTVNLDKLVNAGYISDKNKWSVFTEFLPKGEAVAIIDKLTGGTWKSNEATDNPWYSKHVYSLCGKNGGDPDNIKIITDPKSWLSEPNGYVSKASFMALVDKSTGGITRTYKDRVADHWGRNYLDSLCDKGFITSDNISKWNTSFDGTITRGNAIELLCKAFRL